MTFTDAAREVLRLVGRPLHYKEITELAIEKNLLSHVGKSPEVTMGARLAATLKKEGNDNPLVRIKPGVFALREWDDETLHRGLEGKRPDEEEPEPEEREVVIDEAAELEGAGAAPVAAELGEAPIADAGVEAVTPDVPAVPAPVAVAPRAAGDRPAERGRQGHRERGGRQGGREPRARSGAGNGEAVIVRSLDGDEDFARHPDEAMRADLAAGASDLFAEEEDDDQPILARLTEADEAAGEGDGRKRRRRRRRRGVRGPEGGPVAAPPAEGLPSYTTTPAFAEGAHEPEEGPARGPQVIELTGANEGGSLDLLAGRELSDAVAGILGSFERTVGPVSLRQIAETALRRGRLTGDPQIVQSQVAAAVRADNARRLAAGQRPRFRLAGGRVGLTDWLLDGELSRLEREAVAAVGRYRDAARRTLQRKLAELPGHAFVELCLLALERVGVSRMRAVKVPGAAPAETHFSGVLYAPAGVAPGPVAVGDGLKLAIAIRKDGRDVGRERVTELRGSMHHFGGANMGWLVTAGQAMNGAREEASSGGTPPVVLIDGQGLARLCEEHGVAVVRAQHPVAIPDVDLFEALRAS